MTDDHGVMHCLALTKITSIRGYISRIKRISYHKEVQNIIRHGLSWDEINRVGVGSV